MKLQKYVIKTEGFILGNYYQAKDTIELSDRQAATFVKEGRIALFGLKKSKPAAEGKPAEVPAK